MIKLGLLGAGGRMGQAVAAAIQGLDDMILAAQADKNDPQDPVFDASDVVIDFTPPGLTEQHAARAAAAGAAYVVGTTGLKGVDEMALNKAAEKIALVQAGNFSLGVNMVLALVEQAARALDAGWDIEILEMHHRAKVDAPSGTAKMLGEAAAKGRKTELADVAQHVRDGVTGARPAGEIGFQSLRGGGVVGDHTVMFAGPAERLEITHKAEHRGLFADGALVAARFVSAAKPGRYTMQDVLGL